MTEKWCNINIWDNVKLCGNYVHHFVISKLIWLAVYEEIRFHVHKSDYEDLYISLFFYK